MKTKRETVTGFNGRLIYVAGISVLLISLVFGTALALISPITPQPPAPLGTLPVPEPSDLDDYVADREAAIQLGKALFWDMQLGSDGKTACATCHYHAGSDNRHKNQLNPGFLVTNDPDGNGAAGDQSFQSGAPNSTLQSSDFPFHQRQAPLDQKESPVATDSNDVVSSQGVRSMDFVDIIPGSSQENGVASSDTVFNLAGVNVRRVAARNAPSIINSVYNLASFRDGRANDIFNGRNPFGAADSSATILINNDGALEEVALRMTNASLASQAMGPPLNDVEMSFTGRTWPKIGKKMLSLKPLGGQLVHPQDSVLGDISRATLTGSKVGGEPGLKTTYSNLIKAAFKSDYWSSGTIVTLSKGSFIPSTSKIAKLSVPRKWVKWRSVSKRMKAIRMSSDEYSQMEANFSLFFGLSVQLYESTLVSGESRYDQFQEGEIDLTDEEKAGLDIFLDQGRCGACHGGPLFSNAVRDPGDVEEFDEVLKIERMPSVLEESFYDRGFYNIAATRNDYDIGKGGSDPYGYPLSFSRLAMAKAAGTLPAGLAEYIPDLPCSTPCPISAVSVDGAFRTPSLRNVELTGPYFHNGGAATLMQIIDFYARGGNFPVDNIETLNPLIAEIRHLQDQEERKHALVAFLLTLTDDRVKFERAPFDHPQLFIPVGHDPGKSELPDITKQIPPIGEGGRIPTNLAPLSTFLGLDPFKR